MYVIHVPSTTNSIKKKEDKDGRGWGGINTLNGVSVCSTCEIFCKYSAAPSNLSNKNSKASKMPTFNLREMFSFK